MSTLWHLKIFRKLEDLGHQLQEHDATALPNTSNTFGIFLNVFRMYVFVVEYVESLLKDTFSSARM